VGWDHTAREKRLAPIGEYRPVRYSVIIHDSFEQAQLRAAALAIRNGMTVPEFFQCYRSCESGEIWTFRSTLRRR
jgi:hypothetical protein